VETAARTDGIVGAQTLDRDTAELVEHLGRPTRSVAAQEALHLRPGLLGLLVVCVVVFFSGLGGRRRGDARRGEGEGDAGTGEEGVAEGDGGVAGEVRRSEEDRPRADGRHAAGRRGRCRGAGLEEGVVEEARVEERRTSVYRYVRGRRERRHGLGGLAPAGDGRRRRRRRTGAVAVIEAHPLGGRRGRCGRTAPSGDVEDRGVARRRHRRPRFDGPCLGATLLTGLLVIVGARVLEGGDAATVIFDDDGAGVA
jgi:hypothetical protein